MHKGTSINNIQFRGGGGDRFSKIEESPYKKGCIIGGKSEIGGRGLKNFPKKLDIIYGWPLKQKYLLLNIIK